MCETPEDQQRHQMVRTQLEARGIADQRVLDAFGRVPRHLFVPAAELPSAYADHPLPIGSGQTISQPYVVAYMLEQARLEPTDRVLEIGTGSGYQTALLAELVDEVYSIERIEELATRARELLRRLGYANVRIRVGDGALGWPEYAPYDAVVGSAAAAEIPPELLQQLRPGGRLIMPVGYLSQQLVLMRRRPDGGFDRSDLLPVRFVPLIRDERG